MSSIIEGYNYDIFISYRQKDNKHDGWVTKFVDNLKGELEATFKEDVSLYFDENPHDRLQETHNVDKSLESKLKCLIFIPIISQTYCDPNSYAWQYEFLAFIKMSENDRFGKDVKLRSGNVASRILPIRIHDLEPEDVKLFEKETGSVLRALDFVFKTSTGVSRSLKVNEDHPNDNLNKTFYSDQINKIALAIKEIILGMKIEPAESVEEKSLSKERKVEIKKEGDRKKLITATLFRQKTKKRLIALVLVFLCVVGAFAIFKIIGSSNQTQKLANLEKSVAVLPFSDFSAGHDQEYFANGMMEEILNQLTKIKDLEVISRTSSMIYKNSKLSLKSIAHELGVSKIVEGSVQKADGRVRITVQLIDGTTEKHLWSESFDRDISDIFSVQTEISMNIARELKAILTPQEEDLIRQIPTKNLLAYDYYLKGSQYGSEVRFDLAIRMFDKAIEQDPEFALAYLVRAHYYSNIFFTKDEYNNIEHWEDFDHLARADLKKAMEINPNLPEVKYTQARLLYNLDRNNDRALELLNELITQTPNNSGYIELKCWVLRRKGLWEEHLKEMRKGFLLDPLNGNNFIESAHTYRLLRRYSEAMELLNKPHGLSMQLGIDAEIRYFKLFTTLLWKGNLEEALKISELSNAELGYNNYLGNCYFYFSREFDKLIPVAEKTENQFKYFPKTLNLAQAHFLRGNNSLCKYYADSAVTELNIKIREFPNDDRFYAALGYAYAYKGENKKAIENAQKAVELKPLTLDAWQGFEKEKDLANIYALTGEYDLAMDKIEFLLTIPGELSVPLLKIDPAYDKLRGLPRFQRILATEYKTNY